MKPPPDPPPKFESLWYRQLADKWLAAHAYDADAACNKLRHQRTYQNISDRQATSLRKTLAHTLYLVRYSGDALLFMMAQEAPSPVAAFHRLKRMPEEIVAGGRRLSKTTIREQLRTYMVEVNIVDDMS